MSFKNNAISGNFDLFLLNMYYNMNVQLPPLISGHIPYFTIFVKFTFLAQAGWLSRLILGGGFDWEIAEGIWRVYDKP